MKKTFADYDLVEGSKMLLYPAARALKPEGVRWWCRFPSHEIVDYLYTSTSEQSICFIPNEDVEIVGFGAYEHQYDYVHNYQITTWYKVYDTSNTNQIEEGEFATINIEDDKFKPD